MKIVKKMECFFQETIYNWKVKPEYYEKTTKIFKFRNLRLHSVCKRVNRRRNVSGIIFYNEIKRTENTVFMINNPVYRRQSYP